MFIRVKKILIIGLSVIIIKQPLYAEDIEPIDCMIEPNAVVELSSPVTGVLETLLVDRSDEVKKGQIIGTLNSDTERVAVETSQERLRLITIENKRARALYRDKVITLSDKDKSDNEKILLELDLQNAKAQLEKRKIKSPINGQVVTRYFNPGEFVETDPIFKLAQLDPLKIEVVSPISNFGKIVKGMTAKIVPEYGSYENLYARVVIVDKVIDAASGTFGIRLALKNKGFLVPGGLKCKVKFMPLEFVENTKEAPVSAVVDVASNENKNNELSVEVVDKEKNIPLSCISTGPYKKLSSINNIIKKVEHSVVNKHVRKEKEINSFYQVNGEIFDISSTALNKVAEMKAAGINDVSILKYEGKLRISLGMYSKKSFAENRIKQLKRKNYQASMGVFDREVNKYWLDLVYTPQLDDNIRSSISKKQLKACDKKIEIALTE